MITKEVITQSIRGDERALYKLYRLCYPETKKICLRYYSDDGKVSEMVNDIFMKVVSKLHKYDQERPFFPWFRTIARNRIIDELRKRNSFHRTVIGFPDEQSLVFYREEDETTLPEAMLRTIRALPVRQRTVLNLIYFEELSHTEVADHLGISVATSRWYLSDAIRRLRFFARENNDPLHD